MSISYEDFAKLDIRIGTIKTAEVVEGADRLLKLEVDIGEENPRQIVSGIREYFEDIEELVGRQCPFLVNLEARTIRGLESQGMILAGGAEDVFTLLHPGTKVPSGTPIK
ncbi:tRNA-binding protein [Candidatus Nomurabacteria bacterium]|nr:tRNA-binding protein [Candidatus Kaiserbacteria bacterium]MCB9815244.1 tRNA-binding protein [Candidatus Nomurabacteria bacterium]